MGSAKVLRGGDSVLMDLGKFMFYTALILVIILVFLLVGLVFIAKAGIVRLTGNKQNFVDAYSETQ